MILIDANLLLYAYDRLSPIHDRAVNWLEEALSSEDEVGLALVSVLAFLRIGTDARVFERPLMADEAMGIASGWLARPNVGIVQPTRRHFEVIGELAQAGKARGPLLMDAHVAALAIEHGATLCTSDRDFTRFPGLRIEDPLAS
ncbi:MAG TPA: TA system VapC family ribonuclease toxin [Actinomycetota bacterium]